MKNVLTIIKKEFNRFFKDKRMVAMIFLPGILIFALYSLMGTAMSDGYDNLDKPLAYVYKAPQEIAEELDGKLTYYEGTLDVAEAKEKVREGALDLAVFFPEDFEDAMNGENVSADNPPEVKIYYNSNSAVSSVGYSFVSNIINGHNRHAFTINSSLELYDLMDLSKASTDFLAMLIPLLMFSLLASSCISVAPEAIAGEKERGTMATMLITPVKRIEIVLGKIISLSCFAMLSGLSSFIGVILSLPKLSNGMFNFGSMPYGVGEYFMLFGLIISLVLAMICTMSVLSTLAKNVKESTMYMTPVMIVIIVLGMCTTFFTNPSVWLSLIPFLGSGIAMSSVLSMTASPLGVALAIISNVALAGIFTVITAVMFKNENIMLKK